MIAVTLAGTSFAVPVNFQGETYFFDLFSEKSFDYGTFGRQKASQLTVLASLGVQLLIFFGLGAITIFLSHVFWATFWLATPVFLFLAILGILRVICLVLKRMDEIALKAKGNAGLGTWQGLVRPRPKTFSDKFQGFSRQYLISDSLRSLAYHPVPSACRKSAARV